MDAEVFARNLVVILPFLLIVWILFEKKLSLKKRLSMATLMFAIFLSFVVFYSTSRLRHDFEMKEKEYKSNPQ